MVDDTSLYQQIAESIRQEILRNTLLPGAALPSVREMARRWNCTPGTVQRAYRELARQGLIISRPGQGTHVTLVLPLERDLPLRRANLVHQAEAFLLEVLTAGYSPAEIEGALRLALDRWRAFSAEQPENLLTRTLRFVGSHDPAITLIASRFSEIAPGYALELRFAGSLGGLMALARGEADLAGSHLWDEESNTHNAPFVRRLLPGRRVALLTLAHRHLGLIVQPGNPLDMHDLNDLAQPGLRFINRQRGAGTRVWLDAGLRQRGISPSQIAGYDTEVPTHSEAARGIAEGIADAALGVEAAAFAYGLAFIPLTTERYDLVISELAWQTEPVQLLANWLAGTAARETIATLGGYDVSQTGRLEWIG